MPYNLISCSGWEAKVGSYVGSSGCIKARLGFVLLFFVLAILRRWGGEEIGISFSFILALIGGLIPYFLIVTIFGSFKVALGLGLLGGIAGGYIGGLFFNSENE